MDVYKDLQNAKKAEIIKMYAEKYRVADNIIEVFYDYLSQANEKQIKKLKKGTYKYKYKITRNYYDEGQILNNIKIEEPVLQEIKEE